MSKGEWVSTEDQVFLKTSVERLYVDNSPYGYFVVAKAGGDSFRVSQPKPTKEEAVADLGELASKIGGSAPRVYKDAKKKAPK